MTDKLISLRADEQGRPLTESGLFLSTHKMDCPLWIDGRNVIFKDGGPQKEPGHTQLLSVAGAGVIRGMDALQDDSGTQRLFYGDQANLYMWDTSTQNTISTGHTGALNESGVTPATAWSFARWSNWMLATNGVDAPRIWKTGASDAALAGATFTTAEIFLRRGPHILAFNTNNGSLPGDISFEWCDADLPEDWTPTATNAAGNAVIRDMDGAIKAAINFGEYIIALGKNQVYQITYAGSPLVFVYKPLLTGIGAVGKMAVVQAGRLFYGMSDGGIWQCDGVSFRYIDTPALKEYIDGQIDTSQMSKVVAWYDDTNEIVNFSLPTTGTGENTFTVGYRTTNQSWTIRDWGRSAAVPQVGVFSEPYTALTDDTIVKQNTGVDAHTSAITAYVQSKPLDMGDARAWKSVEAIALQLRRLVGTVQVKVGSQANLDDAIAWSDLTTLDDGFETIWLRGSGSLAAGRFISFYVQSTGVGDDWALSGFDMLGSVVGYE